MRSGWWRSLLCLSFFSLVTSCSGKQCKAGPKVTSSLEPEIFGFDVDTSEQIKICKDQCVAQWKTDFNVYFQKNFDNDFYEFPLDATITSSRKHFLAFCRMTTRKILCFKKQCGVHRRRMPWSTDIHLCHYHKRQFLNSLRCFNLTATGAHHTCNRYCTKLSNHYQLKFDEEKYLANLKLTRTGNVTYMEMSVKCYFQICQYECRKALMKQRCEGTEKTTAIDALFDYYAHDQLDQYQTLANQDQQIILPLMCRTLLPHRYQVNDVANEIIKNETELLKQETNNTTFYRILEA